MLCSRLIHSHRRPVTRPAPLPLPSLPLLQQARVTAFPSLSPPTNSIVQPRFNIYAGPHAGSRSGGIHECRSEEVLGILNEL